MIRGAVAGRVDAVFADEHFGVRLLPIDGHAGEHEEDRRAGRLVLGDVEDRPGRLKPRVGHGRQQGAEFGRDALGIAEHRQSIHAARAERRLQFVHGRQRAALDERRQRPVAVRFAAVATQRAVLRSLGRGPEGDVGIEFDDDQFGGVLNLGRGEVLFGHVDRAGLVPGARFAARNGARRSVFNDGNSG